MNRCVNVPICICGNVISYWKEKITHAEAESGRFKLTCGECKKELSVYRKTMDVFEVSNCHNELEKRVEFEKEMSAWTYVGRRSDGSLYIASMFDSEAAVLSFCESNKWVPVAIGEFKGTFKMCKP